MNWSGMVNEWGKRVATEADVQRPDGKRRQGQLRLPFGGLCEARFEGTGRGAVIEMDK